MNIRAITIERSLLRSGRALTHYQCDCCGHFVLGLSPRGWCGHCEFECTAIGQRVREKLKTMGTESS